MGYIDVDHITYSLPDGRILLNDITLKAPKGAKLALVGANGSGKTTLLKIINGDILPHEGKIHRVGTVSFMRQMVAVELPADATIMDLFIHYAPERIRLTATRLINCENELIESENDTTLMNYAAALADYTDAGGFDSEVLWDICTIAAMETSYADVKYRKIANLSGGQQKRLVLEYLFRGPSDVLLLDEPDNFLDVPAKLWLETHISASEKTIIFISHDRELLANTATAVVTIELGSAGNITGNISWTHPNGYSSYASARNEHFLRLEEQQKRWDEQYAKLRAQVLMYRQKAAYNSDMASRYRAAQSRLERFEADGKPTAQPREQHFAMRLSGARTAKRAVICADLALDGLTLPFSTEIWYGERIGVLGANGSGKSHFLRLLAAGSTDPEKEHEPVTGIDIAPVAHTGTVKLGSRVRPGWFIQTHEHPELVGRTLLDILHHGDEHRNGLDRQSASRALDRYELAGCAQQNFESLSGGQQARFQILLLELSGATLLLLDELTDNLDVQSAEALESCLAHFKGTIICVTHDRWFAKNCDRFLIYDSQGKVFESTEPVWQ